MILSYNHPEITARCVSSALQFLPNEKLVLVHNGSHQNHINQLKNQFPSIRHLEVHPNKGYSGGVNAALKWAFSSHEWAFLLTNDTEIMSWSLDHCRLAPGLYSPVVWFRNKGRLDYLGGRFNPVKGHLQHLKENSEEISVKGYPYVPGTAFLMSKDVFESVGEFDETLHTYWEDVDFGVRAHRRGIYFGNINSIEILHLGGKTTRKNSYYTRYLFRRNRWRVSWRYCPWYLKPLLAMRLFPDVIKLINFYFREDKKSIRH